MVNFLLAIGDWSLYFKRKRAATFFFRFCLLFFKCPTGQGRKKERNRRARLDSSLCSLTFVCVAAAAGAINRSSSRESIPLFFLISWNQISRYELKNNGRMVVKWETRRQEEQDPVENCLVFHSDTFNLRLVTKKSETIVSRPRNKWR